MYCDQSADAHIILALSSSSFGLWSTDSGTAAAFRHKTARESPKLATVRVWHDTWGRGRRGTGGGAPGGGRGREKMAMGVQNGKQEAEEWEVLWGGAH